MCVMLGRLSVGDSICISGLTSRLSGWVSAVAVGMTPIPACSLRCVGDDLHATRNSAGGTSTPASVS